MKEWEEYSIKGMKCCNPDGNHDEGITYITKAISLCDDESEIGNQYYARGLIFVFKNDIPHAIADLKIASDYGCEDALDLLKNKGITYTPKSPPPMPSKSSSSSPQNPSSITMLKGGTFGIGGTSPALTKAPPDFTGKGKFLDDNENIYEGDYVEGKQTGKGKYTWAKSGEVYEGDWVDGKFHGTGRLTYRDKRVYEGDWTNDALTGKGKMTYPNGKVEEGEWKDGEFLGKEE